jgi:hypothetical protein
MEPEGPLALKPSREGRRTSGDSHQGHVVLRRLAVTTIVSAAAASAAFAQNPASESRAPVAPAVRQPLPHDSLTLARTYVTWLWSNQIDSIAAHGQPEYRTAAWKTDMVNQLGQIVSQVGVEDSVIEEKWVRRNGNRQYWRTSHFSEFSGGMLTLRIVMMPDGSMAGMGLNPSTQNPPIDPEP